MQRVMMRSAVHAAKVERAQGQRTGRSMHSVLLRPLDEHHRPSPPPFLPGLSLWLRPELLLPVHTYPTPLQWYGVDPEAEKRLKRLERALGKAGVDFRPESYKWSLVQVGDAMLLFRSSFLLPFCAG